MAITFSEISVAFAGTGAGTGELTWGQMGIWRATQRNDRNMNLIWAEPLPEGTTLEQIADRLRFIVSRHPALRTRLRFVEGPSGDRYPRQVVADVGEVPLHIADVGDGDDPATATEELRSRYELAWFDYENEFPVWMGVVRQSGTLVQLVVCYSHVMVDGAGLDALEDDLRHVDVDGGEPAAPPPGLNPLELARKQGSTAVRRQSERAIRYWADQLERLPAWELREPERPQEPRFAELAVYSPAMELAMRAVSARTGANGTSVLLAAYAAAVAQVFGRNPSVAQLVVSNRFRPGLADMVSQVSQHGICVVDADAAFDQVVARAQKAVTGASFYAYYDPVACDAMIDEIATRRGRPLDIYWCLNDRRSRPGPAAADDEIPSGAELARVLPRTKLYWDHTHPRSDATLFLHVSAEPRTPSQRALAEGLPAVYMKIWADMWHFAHGQIEALAKEMETVVVAAAFEVRAATCLT